MVSNVQIVKVDTTSVTLNWTQPIEYEDNYSYLVLTKESLKPANTQNVTVNIENATLTDLTPGINYTFTIITQVANIQADGVEISSYTRKLCRLWLLFIVNYRKKLIYSDENTHKLEAGLLNTTTLRRVSVILIFCAIPALPLAACTISVVNVSLMYTSSSLNLT